MKIEQSELKDLNGVVTITIEPADYQEEVAKELKQVRQKAQMPGFRPGMVPAGLVKKMYGKGILADILNKKVCRSTSRTTRFRSSVIRCPARTRRVSTSTTRTRSPLTSTSL